MTALNGKMAEADSRKLPINITSILKLKSKSHKCDHYAAGMVTPLCSFQLSLQVTIKKKLTMSSTEMNAIKHLTVYSILTECNGTDL